MTSSTQKLGHPATFNPSVLAVVADLLDGYPKVLDPFAGTGAIHTLTGHETVGVEIEPEWASQHVDTICGNALTLPFDDASFDAIATSPTFGNRLADHHDAKDGSHRTTYRHMLGHELSPDNSGQMQWGNQYRSFHYQAWAEAIRVLKPHGLFVLNIKDHIRAGTWQDVSGWHIMTLQGLGLTVTACRPVATRGNRYGANAELRVGAELVIAFKALS